MKTIDLNCDLGESFGHYTLGMDEQVIPYITSANIACGWHAGDPVVMNSTVLAAKSHGVSVGAHPGYPDLMGFGRRRMSLTYEEIKSYLIYQIGALQAFCQTHHIHLQHVKPHGALYNDAIENEEIARAVAQAILCLNQNLGFVVLAGKKGETMRRIGEDMGLSVALEAFPDRAYSPQGTLMPRNRPDAVITDPALVTERALQMAEGFVIACDGSHIALDVQTLCVHGDSQIAVQSVKNIRRELAAQGVRVAPWMAHVDTIDHTPQS